MPAAPCRQTCCYRPLRRRLATGVLRLDERAAGNLGAVELLHAPGVESNVVLALSCSGTRCWRPSRRQTCCRRPACRRKCSWRPWCCRECCKPLGANDRGAGDSCAHGRAAGDLRAGDTAAGDRRVDGTAAGDLGVSNVLRASGGQTTVVLVSFVQTGDCRRPSCRRKGNGDLRVDERAAGHFGVVDWDACPWGRSESGASDFRADGRATGDHRADGLLSTIFA